MRVRGGRSLLCDTYYSTDHKNLVKTVLLLLTFIGGHKGPNDEPLMQALSRNLALKGAAEDQGVLFALSLTMATLRIM